MRDKAVRLRGQWREQRCAGTLSAHSPPTCHPGTITYVASTAVRAQVRRASMMVRSTGAKRGGRREVAAEAVRPAERSGVMREKAGKATWPPF